MSYSTMNISYDAPRNSMVAPLVGAVVGAIVGAVCFAAASAIAPSNLYTASAVRPAVSTVGVPVAQTFQTRQMASAQFAAPASNVAAEEASQNTAVYGLAFGMFAAVAGAVNGLFLYNRRVSMASTTGRREALMAGAAAAGFAAAPAFAAYGEGANVFGKAKEVDQFLEISGEGWAGRLPAKWFVSKEKEFANQVARWEDPADQINAFSVIVVPAGKNSITEAGSLDEVRNNFVTPYLGQQSFAGSSISEGGFAPNRYAAVSLIDQKQVVENGKTYYEYQLLSRTSDGSEGGKHQLYKVAASNGKVIVFRALAGDKRWFRGVEKFVRKTVDDFRVL